LNYTVSHCEANVMSRGNPLVGKSSLRGSETIEAIYW